MIFDLIVSQGRIADRTSGAIPGAELTAKALTGHIQGETTIIGTPSPAQADDWQASLPQARDTLTALRKAITHSFERGNIPILVANTCSASLASLPMAAHRHPEAIILWIDAHGDFNTPETTGSGYLGGMVLAGACGQWDSGHGAGLDPRKVILVGARDIDAGERALLVQAGVRTIAPEKATPQAVLEEIGEAPVWIHVDWDVLEPGYVPAAYKVPEGLLPEQVKAIFAALRARQIVGVELAEFEASENPAENAKAISIIADTVAPLFRTS